MLIKRFIKLLESKKYKIVKGRFTDCTGFAKIITLLFKGTKIKKHFNFEYLEEIFKGSKMLNVDNEFKRTKNWCREIPFVLPEQDSSLIEPLALPVYVQQYGLDKLIKILKEFYV